MDWVIKNKFNKQHLYFYGALGYLFLIPFEQKLATLAMIVWAILALLSLRKRRVNSNWRMFMLPALYLIYTAGLFLAYRGELKYLEHRLSFLLFPALFILFQYTPQERKKMMKAFLWGLVGAGFYCLFFAIYRSMEFEMGSIHFQPAVLDGKKFMESIMYGGNYFFGNHFSIFHQTVYFAMYFSVGLCIVLFKGKILSLWERWFLLIFYLFILFLISNKASFIVLTILFFYWLHTLQMKFRYKLIALGCILTGIIALTILNPRVSESLNKISEMQFSIDKSARYGYSTRLLTWDASIELIKARPIAGYGVGNAQDALNNVYAKMDYQYPLREKLNAHNQFLQIWIENGVVGILLLILIFVLLIQRAYRFASPDKSFLIAIVFILLINALFESILNRFSGISFFAFLTSFIFSLTKVRSN